MIQVSAIQATPFVHSGLVSLFVFGLVVALALPALLHLLIRTILGVTDRTLKTHAMYTAEPAPALANLQFQSWEYGIPLLVTLSDRKVYVGYPAYISSSFYSQNDGDIHITPLISGYRQEGDLRLVLNTPYDTVLDEITKSPDEKTADQFTISIPVREIVHGHLFDPSLQDIFHKHSAAPIM
ncbi:hypothetical protein [Arhodomonas sp. AD133]|uniref:hypothetical protein n=1 Tax=Arhodomonas sp. AD133 TaxID=3415009 RepID=UPI003EBBE365